jgi:hypothetical protein
MEESHRRRRETGQTVGRRLDQAAGTQSEATLRPPTTSEQHETAD